jgi:hypothetical protein
VSECDEDTTAPSAAAKQTHKKVVSATQGNCATGGAGLQHRLAEQWSSCSGASVAAAGRRWHARKMPEGICSRLSTGNRPLVKLMSNIHQLRSS